jgi:hypothetical protein
MPSNNLPIIPVSQNFSELEFGENSYDIPGYEIDYSEVDAETTIIAMLKSLSNDRERVILLLMVMAKDGYAFKHKDVAIMFQSDYSWYMRIVRGIKQKLITFDEKPTKNLQNTPNHETKSEKYKNSKKNTGKLARN